MCDVCGYKPCKCGAPIVNGVCEECGNPTDECLCKAIPGPDQSAF